MADSPFIEPGGEGPGFDADAAAAGADQVRSEEEAQARAAGAAAFTLDEIPEEKVRHALFVGGDGLHAVVGVGDYDWVMTQRDLDRIAPSLTRILNRYDTTRAVAAYSDQLALVMGFGLYGWRSVLERVAVLREEPGAPPDIDAQPRPMPPPPPGPAPGPPPGPPSSPAPEAPPPAGVGGDHFPGAGAPREPGPVAQVEIAPGYVTRAERIRQARERKPIAVPAEAPTAAQ